MFGVGPLELGVLLIVAVILLGPDKLPTYARDAARLLKKLRAMADDATKDIREELGPEYRDLDPRQLHPKALIQKHIFEPAFADEELPSGSGRAAAAAVAGAAAAAAMSPSGRAAPVPAAGPADEQALHPDAEVPVIGSVPRVEGTPWDADAT